jgi:hypothetical protein
MADVSRIFTHMPSRYKPGVLTTSRSFYFSVGDLKYTVKLTPQTCVVETGKTVEAADVVLKTTPELFERVVLRGEMPGMMDIARGKFKTNDPAGLQQLRDLFDLR